MKIIRTLTYQEMSQCAADFMIHRFCTNETIAIGLATGRTPTGMYHFLNQYLHLGLRISNVHFYNIDEYCGIDDKPGTCNDYLKENFYLPSAISNVTIHPLLEDNYKNLDQMLQSVGGLDTIILGLGENGHIAYNEPNTPFNSETHRLSLTKESKMQHGDEFGGIEKVPEHAVTMGIKTIMQARHILFLVNGSQKASILRKAIKGPVTEEIPASILQMHPDVTLIADNLALI